MQYILKCLFNLQFFTKIKLIIRKNDSSKLHTKKK